MYIVNKLFNQRCINRDLLSDGNLRLEVFIELVNEEVIPNHDVDDETASKMKSLVNKFESMESKFSTMEERMAALEAGNRNLNDQLAERLEVIDGKISSLSRGGSCSSYSRDLECPICAETVRPPMRLYQCGQVGDYFFNVS